MAVLGIIAEFNPLHNGHLHLLQEAHNHAEFDATVCVMSGNFLQRGDPAICNKWARTEMALQSGIDLVIELPFSFAVRSAYYFARGAIQLLTRTGVVTHLAFGSETGNIDTLKSLSTIIANEPEKYKSLLKQYLSQGFNFPSARSRALQSLVGGNPNEIRDLLVMPNNILALEYLRVIEKEYTPLTPITIARTDSGYHSTHLSRYASASAIRNTLVNNQSIKLIETAMPAHCLSILEREMLSGRAPVLVNSMAQSILVKLRTMPIEQLRNIYEISEGLEYRIKQAASSCGTVDELKQAIKSKRYSFTRINRILLYSLCDLCKTQVEQLDEYGPSYVHVLGFSSKGQKILQEIKNKSRLVVFNRGGDVKNAYIKGKNTVLGKMLALDTLATDIYTLLYPEPSHRKGALDFTTSPIKIDRD
ncbi:MAG: nucleotidyltransferase [Syntrophomonas sp.]